MFQFSQQNLGCSAPLSYNKHTWNLEKEPPILGTDVHHKTSVPYNFGIQGAKEWLRAILSICQQSSGKLLLT